MASIRKRGSSYLIVVSMGYDHQGRRCNPLQKTVHPPKGFTPKQAEKWLNEQATLFEMECRNTAPVANKKLTLAEYTEYWLKEIAPNKMAWARRAEHLPPVAGQFSRFFHFSS